MLPAQVTAFLLPEAMARAWPLVLSNFNGEFPADEGGFTAMLGRIRQQGHIAECTHAGPRDLREGFERANGRGHHWSDGGHGEESYFAGSSASCAWPLLDAAHGWPAASLSSSFYG